MSRHVRSQQDVIYQRASKRVMEHLGKIFEANREELEEAVHNIVDKLEADFRSMIPSSKKHEEEGIARLHTRGLLRDADTKFKALTYTESMHVSGAQPPECETQQLPDASMADVGDAPGETVEAGTMDTTL